MPLPQNYYTSGGVAPSFPKSFTQTSVFDYPAHLDYREKGVVTPVKDQQSCGSCWA